MAEVKKEKNLPFKLNDEQLEQKINDFRRIYGDGSNGMVTWPRFCAFLGYSIDEVRAVYQRGKRIVGAYSNRADMLERFHTEVRALTVETSDKQQNLAKTMSAINYLAPEGQEAPDPELHIKFGVNGDDRWVDAMK